MVKKMTFAVVLSPFFFSTLIFHLSSSHFHLSISLSLAKMRAMLSPPECNGKLGVLELGVLWKLNCHSN